MLRHDYEKIYDFEHRYPLIFTNFYIFTLQFSFPPNLVFQLMSSQF